MGDLIQLRADSPVGYGHVSVTDIERPLAEARAHLINSIEDAWDLLRWLGERGHEEIGFDTETTGLDRQKDHIRLVQVGDAMDGWAIPFERWGGVVEDIVRRYKGRYIMHNSSFDFSMLENAKIVIPTAQIDDTRIMAHVLSSTGSLALKMIAQKEVDPAAAAAQQALNDGIGSHGGWTWANVPTDYQPYWVYGALDPVLTYRVKGKLWPRVETEAPLSYALEMAVTWVCQRMERKGARVDRAYTLALSDKLTKYCEEVEAWCKTYYHVGSGSYDIAEILIREGVTLSKYTDTGKYSLDKEVLQGIEHPLAKAVLSRRQSVKIVSTYLRHYLEDSLIDGRVHPSINTVGGTSKNPFESGGTRGVRTGRMSMDSPNLQNVPVRTKEGKKIRNCFISGCDEQCGCDEEHTWIKFDADQIEMRIFAHISNDPALIEAFIQARQGGPDMFTRATRDIFRDQAIPKDDLRRQHVKNGFYAILYSAGLEQFARTAGITSLGDANAFLQSLHAKYPGIKDLQHAIESEAFQRLKDEGVAYIRSPLTRRRHVADRGREYALMNYMVQGAAGEILKMKIIEADHAGLGKYMMFPVHDEIDFDVPKSDLPDVIQTLKETMNDDTLLSVPITWTSDTGTRWGEC